MHTPRTPHVHCVQAVLQLVPLSTTLLSSRSVFASLLPGMCICTACAPLVHRMCTVSLILTHAHTLRSHRHPHRHRHPHSYLHQPSGGCLAASRCVTSSAHRWDAPSLTLVHIWPHTLAKTRIPGLAPTLTPLSHGSRLPSPQAQRNATRAHCPCPGVRTLDA